MEQSAVDAVTGSSFRHDQDRMASGAGVCVEPIGVVEGGLPVVGPHGSDEVRKVIGAVPVNRGVREDEGDDGAGRIRVQRRPWVRSGAASPPLRSTLKWMGIPLVATLGSTSQASVVFCGFEETTKSDADDPVLELPLNPSVSPKKALP